MDRAIHPVVLLLAGILPLGTALRFLFIGRSSYIVDEVGSVTIAQLAWPQFAHVVSNAEANMAFYYGLLHFWLALGTDEHVVRSLSAIFAIATIPLLYALGARLFDQRVAVVASLLLALNVFHVWAAQFARSYSLAVFLATLSSLLFVRGVQRSSRGDWIAYTVASVLLVYSHFFGVLVMAGHWASLLFLRRGELPS